MTVRYYSHRSIQIEIFWQEWGECYAAFDFGDCGHATKDYPEEKQAVAEAIELIDRFCVATEF